MAQFVVRNIEEQVKARLKRRAVRSGRSMEEAVRDILRDAVKEEEVSATGLATRIYALFQKAGLKSGIPELRGHKIKPARFDR